MKTHRFDALSFVAGLVALAIGLLYLIPGEPTDIVRFLGGAGVWLWPSLFLLVGAGVLTPLFATKKDVDDPA